MKFLNEELQPLADDLMSYCQKQMGYKRSPDLYFQKDKENSANPLGKTAHYSPQENKVVVYISGRHTKDILRSLAHELVHHLQNTRGEFNKPQNTDPGYAQNDSHLRNMEKEAYLLGNMLFRDWEDNKKFKEINIMNESKLSSAIREMVKEAIAKRLQNEGEKPDFPDVDGDGDKEEPISKAQKDKKAKEGEGDKKSKKDLSKVPRQLRASVAKKMDEQEEEVEEMRMDAGDPRKDTYMIAAKAAKKKKELDEQEEEELKKEYQDKFSDIEATSRLHENKQERINKLLMKWCVK